MPIAAWWHGGLALKIAIPFICPLLGFRVAKYLGVILLLLSFFVYSFSHGTCSSFDADISKCENVLNASGLNSQMENCSIGSQSHGDSGPEASSHLCSCANIFIHPVDQIYYAEFSLAGFVFFETGFQGRQYIKRIDRPPIALS